MLVNYDSDSDNESKEDSSAQVATGSLSSKSAIRANRKRGQPIKIQISSTSGEENSGVTKIEEAKSQDTSRSQFASSLPAPKRARLTNDELPRTLKQAKTTTKLFPPAYETHAPHVKPDFGLKDSYKPLLASTSIPTVGVANPVGSQFDEDDSSSMETTHPAVIQEESRPVINDLPAELSRRGKRDRLPDLESIPVIDADARYQSNIEYNESAENQEAAPVRFIGTGKHQLSTLLGAVLSQKDALESNFTKQRQAKRESKAKYGR